MKVIQSDKKVLLLFFNATEDESLKFSTLLEEINREMDEYYRVIKIDMATKKNLAKKYRIESAPSVVVLDRGQEVKRLKCLMDKEIIKCQLL